MAGGRREERPSPRPSRKIGGKGKEREKEGGGFGALIRRQGRHLLPSEWEKEEEKTLLAEDGQAVAPGEKARMKGGEEGEMGGRGKEKKDPSVREARPPPGGGAGRDKDGVLCGNHEPSDMGYIWARRERVRELVRGRWRGRASLG